VVHLQVELRQQLRRLTHDRHRPLLRTDDREARLRMLAAERDPLYAEVAEVVFEVGSRSPAQAADALAAQLATLAPAAHAGSRA
jgi:shikimate kinase